MLIVHRSERADRLVDALGELASEPLGDPVAAEVVAVPTRGVERWISQRLSHVLGSGPAGGGVCANLAFPSPATLVAGAVAHATGLDPADDPWVPERLVWPLIEVIDRGGGDDRLAPLIRHLEAATPPPRSGRSDADGRGADGPRLRRLATARHIAELFDRYSLHRPEMVRAWAAGDDAGAPGQAAWQPHLWRLLGRRLGVPSPAERFETAALRIRSEPDLVDLPGRISVFGLTRLPPAQLLILDAVAAGRDVHLFVLHPSGRLWDRTAASIGGQPAVRRRDDVTTRLPRHPLLRSWGRDSRELQSVLAAAGVVGGVHHGVDEPPRRSLLGRIQAAIRSDCWPAVPAAEGAVVDRTDRSLQIHSCHGRMRQVEVLRDAVLHLLEDDPSLEARDVIVMCPDIETFAPLIHAAFNVGGAEPTGPRTAPALRVRLADRALRQTNPLLSVAAALLDLAASRVTAPAVVDLVARPPVSRRFAFDQEDLATIERWVAGTAVRWGVDAAHRRPWSLDGVESNTWATGLDRLMLGVAMAEAGGRDFAGVVPYDDMTSTQVDLAGRFAELVTRLGHVIDRLTTAQPLGKWIEALIQGAESLACAAPDEAWQHDEMRAILSDVAEQAGPAGRPGPDLALDEVRALLGRQLQGRPTRANFRTGDLTICTLVPMRSVPHRVVALLGLDDGAFPRHPETDGDDLLLLDPHVGDRDPRSEDRQLLLDALLAARDHLIVTYCGRDERTNRPRPPCAPVAELLDVIDATAVLPDGRGAGHASVTAHPLQPFDRRNFEEGLRPGGPWSFDPVFRDGALSASSSRRPEASDEPLPALMSPVLQVEQLVGFVQHPVRAFLRNRLSLHLGDWSEDLDDRMPLELDALDRWSLGDRLLDAVLTGVDRDRAVRAEQRRGLLPPGALALRLLDSVGSGVDALAAAMAARGFPPGPSQDTQVRIELPDGRTLSGSVPQVRGDTIIQCTYSRLGPKHRLAAWVRFVALSADRPERPVAALSIGRGAAPGSIAVSTLAALPGPPEERRRAAVLALGVVADLYDRGMTGPLPLVCGASAAWAEGRRMALGEDQLLDRASKVWTSSGDIPGERDQTEHVFVYGRHADIRKLLAVPLREDESGPGWNETEPHRFGRLARRLWDPVLRHESLGDG